MLLCLSTIWLGSNKDTEYLHAVLTHALNTNEWLCSHFGGKYKGCSARNVPQVIKIKTEVMKTLNVPHLPHCSVIIFQHNSRSTLMHYSHLGMSLKYHHSRNQSGVFAAIYKEPHPLPHYCQIGDLPWVASVAQTALQLKLYITLTVHFHSILNNQLNAQSLKTIL
jgi:hypothetical protein